MTSVIQVSCLGCCPSVVWWVVPASHWFLHVTSVTTCLQCFGQQAHHPAVHTDCSYSGGGSALHVSELCFASPAPLSLLLQYGIQFWCRLTQVACNTGRMSKDEDDDVVVVAAKKYRSSADADKPHNMFRGQSRSPNMVPFDMLGMVSY